LSYLELDMSSSNPQAQIKQEEKKTDGSNLILIV
jgi:hypothetical protein